MEMNASFLYNNKRSDGKGPGVNKIVTRHENMSLREMYVIVGNDVINIEQTHEIIMQFR